MKTSLLLLVIGGCLATLISPAFGQGKLSVSISASPVYRYLNAKFSIYLPGGKGGPPALHEVHTRQNGNGYVIGLMAYYNFSSQWSLSTGLFLNKTKFDAPTISTKADLTASPDGLQFLLWTNTVRSFQVPLMINYRTSVKRLSLYFSIGALTSVYSTNDFNDSGRSQNTIENIHPHPTLSAGIDYLLNDHFSLIVQPTFIYFLPYEKVISYKNYQMGLQAQLLYKF